MNILNNNNNKSFVHDPHLYYQKKGNISSLFFSNSEAFQFFLGSTDAIIYFTSSNLKLYCVTHVKRVNYLINIQWFFNFVFNSKVKLWYCISLSILQLLFLHSFYSRAGSGWITVCAPVKNISFITISDIIPFWYW